MECVQDKACHLNEGACVSRSDVATAAERKRAEAGLNVVSSGLRALLLEAQSSQLSGPVLDPGGNVGGAMCILRATRPRAHAH